MKTHLSGEKMKGIKFLVDEKGEPEAVLIDLKKNRALWEDIQDVLVSQQRKNEPRIPLAQMVKRLKKAGKLK
jgi:hypothetical protein